MLFDYLMIPGFLLMLGGAIAALVNGNARSWVAIVVTIMCMMFMLGLVPTSLSSIPVALDIYDPVSRAAGFVILGVLLAFLLESFGKLSGMEMLALLGLAGTAESVLFADELKAKMCFAELASLTAVFFVFKNTSDALVRKTNALFAIKILGIVATLSSMALLGSDIMWFNPEAQIFGYKFHLNEASYVAFAFSIAVQCFAMPLSAFLARIYYVSWPMQSLKGLVFPLLSISPFVYFAISVPIVVSSAAPLFNIIGLLSIAFGALAAITETDKYKMLAYNMMGNIGVLLVAISMGKQAAGFVYLVLCAASHICALFFAQRYPTRSTTTNSILIAFVILTSSLPLAYCAPYDTFRIFESILSAAKSGGTFNIQLLLLETHAAVSFLCMFFRIFKGGRGQQVGNDTWLSMAVLSATVLLANLCYSKIGGFDHRIGASLMGNWDSVGVIMSVKAQFYAGAIAAVYLIQRVNRGVTYPQCRWNFDIALFRIAEYIIVLSVRFFSYLGVLIFDCVKSLIYNIGGICGPSPGAGCGGSSGLGWHLILVSRCSLIVRDPSGFTAFAAASLLGCALWVFLIW